MDRNLSRLSQLLISSLETSELQKGVRHGLDVSSVVSGIATWYEKLRNAMDYREEEVVRRASIERILKRRLLFGGTGQTIAAPLIRELLWARYFPENAISEEDIANVAKTIDLYLVFREHLLPKEKELGIKVDSLITELLSVKLETMLNKEKDVEFISNFIFHLIRDSINIIDERGETRDIQVFIAVHRAFAKEDAAFLRFRLFSQYFGEINEANIPSIISGFKKGFDEIERQLNYKLKDRILAYVKRQVPPFLILEEVFRLEKGKIKSLIVNEEAFKNTVSRVAEARYKTIKSRVRTAIIRAVIFILFTKLIFAFAVEATYDNLVFGKVIWTALGINVVVPPLLMAVASLFIRTPGVKNTERIYEKLTHILFEEKPELDRPLAISLAPERKHPVLNFIFTISWWLAFILSFGVIIFILNKLKFSLASEGIFIFFLALIAFFTYRISQTAHNYTIETGQGMFTPILDFFFMPIVKVGRRLAEGLTQINIILYFFDYFIETPFKEIFGFLEQWFFFLQRKREELG